MNKEELKSLLNTLVSNQQYLLRQVADMAEIIDPKQERFRLSDLSRMNQMEVNLSEQLERLQD